MRAAEKLARRVELVDRLTGLDADLTDVAAETPSHRITEEMRRLLRLRKKCREDMRQVGYVAWPLPLDLDEAKVV